MNEICEHKNKPDTCRECHPSPSFKICEGSSSGCSSPTCPAHRSSLQELLKEWKESACSKRVEATEAFCHVHGWSGYEGEIIPDWLTRAYELGVAEERNRILKGLPEEKDGKVMRENWQESEADGFNQCRQQILALLERRLLDEKEIEYFATKAPFTEGEKST